MHSKRIKRFIKEVNSLSVKGEEFLFIIDFELQKPKIYKKGEIPKNVFYDINGISNFKLDINSTKIKSLLHKHSFKVYKKKFKKVMGEILYGNTFLINLTDKIKLKNQQTSLMDIFQNSVAKYKLFYKDRFVVFSPETFIKTEGNVISSYPMKGTIDASIEDSKEKLINDKKELAEHYTIVDLIRNDLSIVAKKVTVEKFRFFDLIHSNNKELWQTSSKVTGELPVDFRENLGDIIIKLLPAGSISGAPKRKTIEIIKSVEKGNRGYYTGIIGWYDGKDLDTGVMIRFIENKKGKLYYRSGCGITHLSEVKSEFNEMRDKVYVPTS